MVSNSLKVKAFHGKKLLFKYANVYILYLNLDINVCDVLKEKGTSQDVDVQNQILYTHQKQKKRKTWQDGFLTVYEKNKKVCTIMAFHRNRMLSKDVYVEIQGILMSEDKKSLDSFFVKSLQLREEEELESDKYLVTVDSLHETKDLTNNHLNKENTLNTKETEKCGYANHSQISKKLKKPFQPVFSKQVLTKTLSERKQIDIQYDQEIDGQQEGANNIRESKPLFFSPVNKKKKFNTPSTQPPTSIQDDERERNGYQKRSVIPQGSVYQSHESRAYIEAKQVNCFTSHPNKPDFQSEANQVIYNASFKSHPKKSLGMRRKKRSTNDLLTLFSANGDDDGIDVVHSPTLAKRPETNTTRQVASNVKLDVTQPTRSIGSERNAVLHVLESTEQRVNAISKMLPPTAATFSKLHLPSVGNQRQTTPSNIDLTFPSKDDVMLKTIPKREIEISYSFNSVLEYKQMFKAALKEHLNIILFDTSSRFHNALSTVDTSALESSCSKQTDADTPHCKHGPAKLKAVRKEGKNNGRLFYSCSSFDKNSCNFFMWADQVEAANSLKMKSPHHSQQNQTVLKDGNSISVYLNSRNIQFYSGAKFLQKAGYSSKKWKAKQNQCDSNVKIQMYIVLPSKKSSTFYSKDDLWVISKSLDFNLNSTFIAKSTFYGPNSSCELEVSPLAAYYTSQWQNNEPCYVIHAGNASTELTCIDNLMDHLNPLDVPVIPHLLKSSTDTHARQSLFNRFSLSCLKESDINDLTTEIIQKFTLNKDQSSALKEIGSMFLTDHKKFVTLIHGVFGAGKSYLLATSVLFLVQLFQLIEERFELKTKLKLLISSTTNVAVDRVLQTLLDLGYEDFVRVGSIKKIAKRVLPYSVHASDQTDHELKELNDLMKSELTNTERGYIKKALEHHRLGVNREKLNEVAVVGVTCAACVFPYLQHLTFQVQLLDECSQMLEPVSMIPIARFKCEKLVLVGDPKQLSPTIQGSETSHSQSLEMTLFERLTNVNYNPVMLKRQYRCHPSISFICNQVFYNGMLKDGITTEDRPSLVAQLPTLSFCDVANGEEAVQSDGSYMNIKEAQFVSKLLRKLYASGIEAHQIGVITQYKSQVRKITALLSDSESDIKSIQISTVDSFQGAEKDIILLSCVRTKSIGFIDCVRRTNVALSRAKNHLIIIGSKRLLSSNKIWYRVLNCCHQQNGVFEKSDNFLKRFDLEEEECVVGEES